MTGVQTCALPISTYFGSSNGGFLFGSSRPSPAGLASASALFIISKVISSLPWKVKKIFNYVFFGSCLNEPAHGFFFGAVKIFDTRYKKSSIYWVQVFLFVLSFGSQQDFIRIINTNKWTMQVPSHSVEWLLGPSYTEALHSLSWAINVYKLVNRYNVPCFSLIPSS